MEKVELLKSYINRAIPYAWNDSESWYEFLGKVTQKVNELIDASNEYFNTDISIHVVEILTGWKNTGILDVYYNELLGQLALTKYNTKYERVENATTSPTLASGTGGNVENGTYSYVVTFVSVRGETGFDALAPTPATITVANGTNKISLANIPIGPAGTTQRNIYRSSSLTPNRYYVLLVTINDNTTTSYDDVLGNSSLPITGSQSKWNTTAGKIYVGDTLAGYVGESNTFIGLRGLMQNTTGFDNTGLGMGVLSAMTTGYNNTAVGVNALWGTNVGINNTAVGTHALQNNADGSSNTAVGVYSLEKNINAFNNTAVGLGALANNTTASNNTAVGCLALTQNTATNNTAVGFQALQNNTSGFSNMAVGGSCLVKNTTGYNNIGMGLGTLGENIDGSGNVGLGASALAGSTSSNNTAVGLVAGVTITTGGNNTLIGAEADVTSGALYRATAIGSGAKVSTSDTMQLGDVNLASVKSSAAFESTGVGAGFILKSPNGTRYRIIVSDLGVLSAVLA